MPLYETVFIARQDIPAQEAEGLAERFSEIVTESGGSVARCEYWGLRTLAYRIKKNRKGHYTMLHIDAPSDAVLEMERNMRINEDVLRYLTIRMESLDESPSIIMQSRTAREERSRRDAGGRHGGSDVKRDGGGPVAASTVDKVKADKVLAENVKSDVKSDGDGPVAASTVDEVKADKVLAENVKPDGADDEPTVAPTVNESKADKILAETAQENVE